MVKAERPDLDKQKNDLVVKVAAGKRTQVRGGLAAMLDAGGGGGGGGGWETENVRKDAHIRA